MMNNLWEGYDGQEVVLLEDIDPFHVKLSHDIKIWADRYSFRGRVLYGSIVLRPKKIVITSQYSPEEIWPQDQKTVEAIRDRFNVIHVEKLNATDDSIPRKKLKAKPALKRAKVLTHYDQDKTCKMCYCEPCICDIIEDPSNQEIEIGSDTEEDLTIDLT